MRPDSTPNCGTKQPCLTLSTVAGNTTAYFTSHSVFHFLPGSHTVNETTRVTVEGINSVSLVGSSLGAGYATVECNGRLSFSFRTIGHVNISNLEFFFCGLVSHVWSWPTVLRLEFNITLSRPPHVALLFSYCSSVTLENVRVMNSYGYGLLEWNVMRTNVINCQFACSNRISHKEKDINTLNHSCPNSSEHSEPGGNAFIGFDVQEVFVNISHSEFAYGIAREPNSSSFLGGGGLVVCFAGESESWHFQIYNCSLHDNVSPFGANMAVHLSGGYNDQLFTLDINKCKFYNGNSTYSGGGNAWA